MGSWWFNLTVLVTNHVLQLKLSVPEAVEENLPADSCGLRMCISDCRSLSYHHDRLYFMASNS